MVKRLSVAALLAASTMLSSGVAQADFINGAFSASSSGLNGVSNIPAGIVSAGNPLLQTIITFNAGTISAAGTPAAFNFVGNGLTLANLDTTSNATLALWSFTAANGFVWTVTGVSNVTAVGFNCSASAATCNQSLDFDIVGSVDGPGAGAGQPDATAFSGHFSVSASCQDTSINTSCDAGGFRSSSWQISGSAFGVAAPPPPTTTTPEPASLALLGAALAGLGIVRRRRS